MNLRDKYILDWVLKNRPDCSDSTLELMENQGMHLLMAFGFQAGRQFQADYPGHEPNGHGVYLEDVDELQKHPDREIHDFPIYNEDFELTKAAVTLMKISHCRNAFWLLGEVLKEVGWVQVADDNSSFSLHIPSAFLSEMRELSSG